MNKVRLKDVALAVGVSEMTASRAMREHSDVSVKTRERILKAAKDLGYVPNKAASMLASRTSQIIPMIVPSLRNRVFLDVIAAAQEVITSEGYQMILLNTQYSLEKETEAVSALMSWEPAALLLPGIDHSDDTLSLLREVDFPVIEMMEIGEKMIDVGVGFSHYKAGDDMGRYLLGKGYESFAFCGSRMDEDIRGSKRYQGFRTTITEAGLTEPLFVDIKDRFGRLVSNNGFEKMLSDLSGIECVYFSNDDLAVGALLTCQRMGIKVPDELAVAGFNDLDIGQLTLPRLTTSRSPRDDIGATAARCAIDKIKGMDLETNIFDLGCELIPRESA